MAYDHKSIKDKVDSYHKDSNDFYVDTSKEGKNKFYSLGMFPYPSGNAHMGHVRVYTLSDVKARYKKLKGCDVIHPMGWDSFGLPAENAAIKHKVRPDLWTEENIKKMKYEQLNIAGWSFDWDKELNTSSPDYYKWTQWLFLEMHKAGLAYRKEDYVNWCPVDKTVLANEQVIDGRSWRAGAIVEKRLMEQWFFKITDYCDKLWDGISKLKNWAPEAVSVQKNWINKNTGTVIHFNVPEFDEKIEVFTTRPDTLFGVTALVIAPEHPLAAKILEKHPSKEVEDYVNASLKKSAVERMQNKEKTGVNTGVKCRHPFEGDCKYPEVDVWIGDYVIADYGTGAVMCVPAHDTRDFEFAKKFGLDIIEVVSNPEGEGELSEAYTEDGDLINSGEFNGMNNRKAIKAITESLDKNNKGEATTTYQLKDWSVGRQRFWGCPIPMVHCDSCGIVPVPESELPVELPKASDADMEDGVLNLKNFPDFVNTTCPSCGKAAKRETDTLDTFLCSSWYAFRYLDNKNDTNIFDSKNVNNFMPVDFYVGGLEHAAQHMIYFRFITKFLNDRGYINFDEPVDHFFCNGMVKMGGHKMSKSRGNVVVPTDAIDKYGADAIRMYILSDTPAELDVDWEDSGIKAKYDFIKKNYNAIENFLAETKDIKAEKGNLKDYPGQDFLYNYYATLKEYEYSMEQNLFHKGVANIHAFSNHILKELNKRKFLEASGADRDYAGTFKFIIKEFLTSAGLIIPFFTEVLLKEHYGVESLYNQTFGEIEAAYLTKSTVNVVVQINGKKKALLEVDKEISEADIEKLAFENADVMRTVEGKNIVKKIYVKGKIYNIVVK
ncbi:MAG: leucine--tRNA ligase [Oligoflexia bacterium]|nr:leucine--tRNA ligase [Oligoflexia bacterium]